MECEKMFRVGYALLPEKVESVVQPSLVALAKQRNIDLVQVDLSKPLVDQAPFHCLVHKLYSPQWNSQLLDFHTKYPDAVIVDSPYAIEPLHNRISMLEVIDNISIPILYSHISLGIPKQVVATDEDSLLSDDTLTLNFPVIAKPLLANGTDKCHEMCLVFNSCALNKVNPPVVLQEFVNHGGVLFKVYVAGDHVKCVKRRSLADVSEDQLKLAEAQEAEGIMPFSQISTVDAPAELQLREEPPLEFIHCIAHGLREATKLHLFNFDMIQEANSTNTTRYLIIDINYFPGFAKVPGFETMLTDFFWDMIKHTRDASTPDLGDNELTDDISEVTKSGCNPHTANNQDAPSVTSFSSSALA